MHSFDMLSFFRISHAYSNFWQFQHIAPSASGELCMAHDPPSPSALAIEAFAANWDQQVDGVFQCPPCHDWTRSNRASIGPGPAPLSPEDVARSVQALAQDVLQLRCELTNLRLALDALSADRPSTPVRFLEETVSALVEALHQDRVESRLLLQQLNCHFDNIQAQLLFLHRRLAFAEHQVVDLQSSLDSLD